GDFGPALDASFNSPGGIAVDSSGNIFVADTLNNRIRELSPMVPIILATNPAGLILTIDSTLTTTPQTLYWVPGATHTLFAPDQNGPSDVNYAFSSWSQGGAASQAVTVNGPASYTASFRTAPTVSCPVPSPTVPAGTAMTITCTASGGTAPY